MKISFLVTYYNQEQYVKDSIESILKIQKPKDWELLIGDDGSDDNTIKKCEEYVSNFPNNIRVYTMPRELGKIYDSVKRASANRLNLLEHCTGDCFCTLDGDDFFTDNSFVLEAIEVMTNNPDISLVAFGYKKYKDGEFGPAHMLPVASRQSIEKQQYLESYYIPAGACVHRISWGRERVAFLKRVGYFDDNDITINSLNYGTMCYINRVVYAYRQTGTSVYNSMGRLEKALINVQGYEVDLKLLHPDFHESLETRYASAILTLYFWRKTVGADAKETLLTRYFCGKARYEELFSYQVFCVDDLPLKLRKIVKKRIRNIERKNARLTAKLIIVKILRDKK